MLPFSVSIHAGAPIANQVVFAVTRAIVAGQLRAGDRFPSVRALSRELRINPNTAQRIVATLAGQGLLEVLPGVGTVVASARPATAADRAALVRSHLEPLVIEAGRRGLRFQELLDLLTERWRALRGQR